MIQPVMPLNTPPAELAAISGSNARCFGHLGVIFIRLAAEMPRSKVNTFYYFIDILAYKNFIQNSSKYIGENQP